jgi:hypothetical protein
MLSKEVYQKYVGAVTVTELVENYGYGSYCPKQIILNYVILENIQGITIAEFNLLVEYLTNWYFD